MKALFLFLSLSRIASHKMTHSITLKKSRFEKYPLQQKSNGSFALAKWDLTILAIKNLFVIFFSHQPYLFWILFDSEGGGCFSVFVWWSENERLFHIADNRIWESLKKSRNFLSAGDLCIILRWDGSSTSEWMRETIINSIELENQQNENKAMDQQSQSTQFSIALFFLMFVLIELSYGHHHKREAN